MSDTRTTKPSIHPLPEDVVFCILSWLPVASLLRFKLVCRSWLSFIESPGFITQHKANTKTKANSLIVMDSNYQRYYPYHSTALKFSLLSGDKLEVSNSIKVPECYKKDNDVRFGDMVASCDGIVCLHHQDSWKDSREVSLWNLATKQVKILPESLYSSPPPSSVPFHSVVGFGFDANTKDYKVVSCIFAKYMSQVSNQIQVYSLSTDSWRRILDDQAVFLIDRIICHLKVPYRNSIYCWVQSTKDKVLSVLTFDFGLEVFGNILLPDELNYNIYHSSRNPDPQLAILREKIACFQRVDYLKKSLTCHLQVWVLNEYPVKESWCKLYKIGPFPVHRPLGFSYSGDYLLLIKEKRLCLCDPGTQEIKDLRIQDQWLLQVVVYNESLVAV